MTRKVDAGSIVGTAKRGIKAALHRASVRADSSPACWILLYHSVDPALPYASVDPATFGEHLDWLAETCEVVALGDLLTAPAADRHRVAITFDDGFIDNHTFALPALAERGLTATFYITTGFIDRQTEVIERFERVLDGAPVTPMTWRQILELQATGMEIGAHTVTHPNLRVAGPEGVEREVRLSKAALEDKLGISVQTFAYPFGKPKSHFTGPVRDAVAKAGFDTAYSTLLRDARPTDDPFALPRLSITGESSAELQRMLHGSMRALAWWQEHAPRRWLDRLSPEHAHSNERASIDA